MQAIQAIENAVPEAPRRRSPFRALVWKEWRLQRWLFLGVILALLAAPLFTAMLLPRSGVLFGEFVCLGGVLVLGGNGFCAEEDDSSARFLESIPTSRTRLYLVKAGVTAALSVAAGLALFAAEFMAPRLGLHVEAPTSDHFADDFLSALFAVASLSWLPAITAALTRQTISSLLAAVALAGGLIAWVMLFFLAPLKQMGWGERHWPWMAWFATITLFLCGVMWIRIGGRTEMKAGKRTLAALVLVLLMPLLMKMPLRLQWTYVTFFKAPESFLTYPGHSYTSYTATPSPSGKHVLFSVRDPVWRLSGSRAFVLDAETGKIRWLSRFHTSAEVLGSEANVWSPEGDRVVFWKPAHMEIWTEDPYLYWFSVPLEDYWVFDTRSGESRSVSDICPGFSADGNAVSFESQTGRDELVFPYRPRVSMKNGTGALFLNLREGSIRRCRSPKDVSYPGLINGSGVYELSVTEATDGPSRLLVCRYSPDSDTAETRSLQLRENESAYAAFCSSDGDWVLFNVYALSKKRETTYRRTCLLEFKSGELTLLASVLDSDAPVMKGEVKTARFLPNSHTVLLFTGEGLASCDAETRVVRPITLKIESPFTMSKGGSPRQRRLSPDGRFALLGLRLMTLPIEQFGQVVKSWPSSYAPSVVEISTGRTWIIPTAADPSWLGPERLLIQAEGAVWSVRYDGTDKKLVLGKREEERP